MTVGAKSRTRVRRLVFKNAKRPDLQGMRAVAVLAVFADHLFGWPSGGFVGVDIFFVLSGFFITGLLLKERSETGSVSFQAFYTRRVKRILPSALLVLAVTVIGAQFLFPAARAKDTLVDALWAAVFGANIRFEQVGADYFQQDLPPSPIQHYWSLSIEEQFYFVWPLLLAGLFLATRKLYRRGHIWARHGGLVAAMALIVAASFTWAMIQSAENPNAAYFSTVTRVWELGVGALVAIAGPWLARIPRNDRVPLAYLGLAGVVASLFLIDAQVQFPAPWAALPVLATAVVTASFHGGHVHAVPMLTNPVARWFGDTSYTLYLWHWPVIILLEAVLPRGLAFYAIAASVALGITALTYHFYEDPIRKSDWLTSDKRLRMWASIGAAAAATMLIAILSVQHAATLDAIREEVAAAQEGSIANLVARPCYGAPAMVTPECPLRTDEPLSPPVDAFAKDTQGQLKCWRFIDEKDDWPRCYYGYVGDDAIRIAIVGDSHAGALIPAFWRFLSANKWNLDVYIGQRCRLKDPPDPMCAAPMSALIDKLSADPYDVVITTGAATDGVEQERVWARLIQSVARSSP